MKITLCQINLQAGEVRHNLARARQALGEAVHQGSDLALLPELWSSGYDLPKAHLAAVSSPAILEELSAFSHQNQLSIGGSLLEAEGQDFYNTFTLLQPTATPVAYRKTHLFRLMDEHQYLKAGNQLINTPLGPFQAGLSICYDLRFPELYRAYALHGVNLFLICAEWPASRLDHWQGLLRARAIENQAFVAAVNTVGPSGLASYGGCSLVISPWGEILLQASTTAEAILSCELDFDQLARVRGHLSVFSDRRPELYERPPTSLPEST